MSTADLPETEIWTLAETAAYLRISLRTLHNMIARGDGPPTVIVGERRRVCRATDVREWLAVSVNP